MVWYVWRGIFWHETSAGWQDPIFAGINPIEMEQITNWFAKISELHANEGK